MGAAVFTILRDEDGDAANQKRLGEALDDGVDQGVQVGLRGDATAKLDEGVAIVVALLLEEPVNAGRDSALDGIEEQSGDDYRGHQTPFACP